MSAVTADLDAAFEMANKWRAATDQEILSAWLPSRVGAASDCLLAKGINSNCAVMYTSEYVNEPGSEGVGSVAYRDKQVWDFAANDTVLRREFIQMKSGSGRVEFYGHSDLAQRFAGITGFEYDGHDSVVLPDEIALVAWEFDHGAFQEHAQTVDADKTPGEILDADLDLAA